MSAPALWRVNSAYSYALTGQYLNLKTCKKSVATSQAYASKKVAQNQATFAEKPLKQSVQTMKKNILSYALKAV
jgi:hypothetical protein